MTLGAFHAEAELVSKTCQRLHVKRHSCRNIGRDLRAGAFVWDEERPPYAFCSPHEQSSSDTRVHTCHSKISRLCCCKAANVGLQGRALPVPPVG